MSLFALPKLTRGQWVRAGIHVAMLAIAIASSWEHSGSDSIRAGYAIIVYFIEIAVFGIAEMAISFFRRLGSAA